MGQDQKVKSRHKRRTVDHNKHSAFPGMRVSKDVIIINQSIKPLEQKTYKPIEGISKSVSYTEPEMIAYDMIAKKLGTLGSASTLGLRSTTERDFYNAYRKLAKAGLAMPLKRKYGP
jgi:hypothetical protein